MADHTDRFQEQGPPLSRLSRRQALAVAGGVGVAAVAGIWPRTALAQPAAAVPNGAGFYRFRLGTCTITLLSDGQAPSAIFPGWGGDPARRDVYEPFLREHLIDPAQVVNNFIPMVVDTGRNKVLVDTGNAAGRAGIGRTIAHLLLSGIRPEEIDTIFITHGHGDHIGGLTTAGVAAYPNARLVMGETEFAFWTGQANPSPLVSANLAGLRSRFTLVSPHHEVVPGIRAISTPGHTVGHMGVLVTSGNASLMHFGDAGGHYLLSLRFPEHYLAFDSDKLLVTQTRRMIFEQAAADRLIVVGYHFPWPGVGHVRKKETYFEFVPAAFVF